MIVLDSSAAIGALDGGSRGERVLGALAAADEIHAPELMLLECANVLRRRIVSGAITIGMAREGIALLEDAGLTVHPHRPLVPAVLDLAGSLTAYDAAYVAVAMAVDAPLLTADSRLARAAERWCDVVVA